LKIFSSLDTAENVVLGSLAGVGGGDTLAGAVVLEEGVGTVQALVDGLDLLGVRADARSGLVHVLFNTVGGAEGLGGTALSAEAHTLREGDVLAEEHASLDGAVGLDEVTVVSLLLVAHELGGLEFSEAHGEADVVFGAREDHDGFNVRDGVSVGSEGDTAVVGGPEHTLAAGLGVLTATNPDFVDGGVANVLDEHVRGLGGSGGGVGNLEVLTVLGGDGGGFFGVEGDDGAVQFIVALDEGGHHAGVFVDLGPGLALIGGLEDGALVVVADGVLLLDGSLVLSPLSDGLGVEASLAGVDVGDDEDTAEALGANDAFILLINVLGVNKSGRSRGFLFRVERRSRGRAATVVLRRLSTPGHEPNLVRNSSHLVRIRAVVFVEVIVDLFTSEGVASISGQHDFVLKTVTDGDEGLGVRLVGADRLGLPDKVEGHQRGEPFGTLGEVLETLGDGDEEVDGGEDTVGFLFSSGDGEVEDHHGAVRHGHVGDLTVHLAVILEDTSAGTVGGTTDVAEVGGDAVHSKTDLRRLNVRGSVHTFPDGLDGSGRDGLREDASSSDKKGSAELKHRFFKKDYLTSQ